LTRNKTCQFLFGIFIGTKNLFNLLSIDHSTNNIWIVWNNRNGRLFTNLENIIPQLLEKV